MKRISYCLALTFALIALPYSLSSSYAADQQAQTSSQKVPGQRIYNNFQQIKNEIDELKAEAATLSGDSLSAMQSRIYEKQLSGMQTLNKLAELILRRQQNQQPVDRSLALASPLFEALGPALTQGYEREKQKYQKLAEDTEELSPDGLRIFLEYQNKITGYFDAFTEVSLNIKAIGLDNQSTLDYLNNELSNRAEIFIGALDLVDRKQAELKRLLKISPSDEGLLLQNNILIEREDITIDHFGLTIDLLASLGIDTDDYQQRLVASSGELTTEMLDIKFASELLSRWGQNISDYFADNGVEVLFKLIIFVAILFAFRFLSRLVERVLLRSLEKSSLDLSSLMKDMITAIGSRLVMLLGILIALSQIGISLGPLLAGLGVAGFIIGFALQDTLGNFASGMMILIYRPYDVGDMVEAAGVFGQVKGMNMVSTTILTIDNQTLVIPNNKIWGDVIKNVTAQRVRRIDMVFGIGYGDDIEHAERIFTSILEEHDKVLSSPKPDVKLHTLGESSVDFVVRPWVKTKDYWDVYWDVTREVKMRMDREGLNIPFPQRDVHIHHVQAQTNQD